MDTSASIKKGEPKGAVYGFSGTDAANMDDHYDPDGNITQSTRNYNLSGKAKA